MSSSRVHLTSLLVTALLGCAASEEGSDDTSLANQEGTGSPTSPATGGEPSGNPGPSLPESSGAVATSEDPTRPPTATVPTPPVPDPEQPASSGTAPTPSETPGVPTSPAEGQGGQPSVPASGGSPAGGSAGVAGAPNTAGSSQGGGPTQPAVCETPEEELFSFFLISYEAVIRESGSTDGFGGDLGGIDGADAICQRVAEYSSPCAANKTWRAFLSTSTVDAIDRIGTGPWHDRVGRLLANGFEDLLADRPTNADPQIRDDFPNEYGIPNHDPDLTGEVDNHQILTGSGLDGRLYTQGEEPGGGFGGTACEGGWTIAKATCNDWTSSEPEGCPRVGHSWPRQGSGVNWISVWNEGGCGAGVVLEELGGPNGDKTVGSAGGYGGFYCFAVTGE